MMAMAYLENGQSAEWFVLSVILNIIVFLSINKIVSRPQSCKWGLLQFTNNMIVMPTIENILDVFLNEYSTRSRGRLRRSRHDIGQWEG